MQEVKYRNFGYKFQYNKKRYGQKCGGKKLTQPDMSRTVKEMVNASNRGLTVNIDNRLYYPDEVDDTLIEINDLSDIDELKEQQETFKKHREHTEQLKKQKEVKTNDETKPEDHDKGGTTED